MPAIRGQRHEHRMHAEALPRRSCPTLATAETIRQSIRALEATLRDPQLPEGAKLHNVGLVSQLRHLLDLRR